MNNITIQNNEMVLNNNEPYAVEPFRNSILAHKNQTEKTISSAVDKVVADAGIIEEYRKKHAELQFVVDLTPEIRKALQSGELKLDSSKGHVFAQIRNADGKFGSKLPIKEVDGMIDPMMLSMALQMKSMEEKLDDIVDMLGLIEEDIVEVLEGQQSDRIALYYSGQNLYLEASRTVSQQMEMMLMSQALKTLSDASAQEMQIIAKDIKYLTNEKYKDADKKYRIEKMNEKVQSINTCFEFIHRSTILKAQIYYERNELGAMSVVLDEYAQFLNNLIIPNAGKLAEMDKGDKRLLGGRWDQRKDIVPAISDFKYQLAESNAMLLEHKEQNYD